MGVLDQTRGISQPDAEYRYPLFEDYFELLGQRRRRRGREFSGARGEAQFFAEAVQKALYGGWISVALFRPRQYEVDPEGAVRPRLNRPYVLSELVGRNASPRQYPEPAGFGYFGN